MALSGTVTPASGGTPSSFGVQASGGAAPYALSALPSPPNPLPMPDHEITDLSPPPGSWRVRIKDPVTPGTDLEFKITDDNGDSVVVTFACT